MKQNWPFFKIMSDWVAFYDFVDSSFYESMDLNQKKPSAQNISQIQIKYTYRLSGILEN